MRGDQLDRFYQRLAARVVPADLTPDSWMHNPAGPVQEFSSFPEPQTSLHAPGLCSLNFDSLSINPRGHGDEVVFKAIKQYPTGFDMASYSIPVVDFLKLARKQWARTDEAVPKACVDALMNIAYFASTSGKTSIDLAFGR